MLDYKKQFLAPLILVSVILSVSMAALILSASRVAEFGRIQDKLQNARIQIITLQKSLSDAETSHRGYLLTYSMAFSNSYDQSIQAYKETYTQLLASSEQFPELQPDLIKLKILAGTACEHLNFESQIQQNDGSYSPHLSAVHKDNNPIPQIMAHLAHADWLLTSKKAEIDLEIIHSLLWTVVGAVFLVMLIIAVLTIGYKKTVHLFEISVKSKNIADQLNHVAHYDVLTDLPNRRQFEAYLNKLTSFNRLKKTPFAIFYMDLDGFKSINDQLGHDAGDEALVFASKRFVGALRDSDFVARLGGDEFTAIIHRYGSHDELGGLANRIIHHINNEFEVKGMKCKLGVSIGVACYPNDAINPEALINLADNAMYEAKRTGKNRVVFNAISEESLIGNHNAGINSSININTAKAAQMNAKGTDRKHFISCLLD